MCGVELTMFLVFYAMARELQVQVDSPFLQLRTSSVIAKKYVSIAAVSLVCGNKEIILPKVSA